MPGASPAKIFAEPSHDKLTADRRKSAYSVHGPYEEGDSDRFQHLSLRQDESHELSDIIRGESTRVK
jgi:hypothetical protein